MTQPEGSLTGTQLEIMEAVWDGPTEGLSASEIWQSLARKREVARTTVLTLVGRLEKRGWLVQEASGKGHRYRAASGREEVSRRMAAEFADAFFGGSASRLVMSLLGARKVSPEELKRLRRLLEEPR